MSFTISLQSSPSKYVGGNQSLSLIDSRYLLWTLEKLEKADNILDELTIVE